MAQGAVAEVVDAQLKYVCFNVINNNYNFKKALQNSGISSWIAIFRFMW